MTGTAKNILPIRKKQGCQPPRHQIMRIEREETIGDVISHDKGCHFCQKCSLIPTDVYST